MSGKFFLPVAVPVHSFISQRYALHAGQSDASASTVSSPTATTSSMGRLSSPARVVSPVQVRSPLIGVLSPTHPGQQTRFGTTPVTPPPSRAPPISPLMTLSRSLPPLMTRNRPLPSAWIEAESDSDDDAVVPTQHPTVGHDSLPPMVPGPAVVPPVVNTLPLVLSQITPEESLLPLNGACLTLAIIRKRCNLFFPDFQSIRNAILANPFYLGEPSHIRLRNANGDETHRKMKAPSQGTSSPDKWYAIVCGTQVGIFLSW